MTTFINIHHFKFVFAWYFYRRPSMRTVRVDWSVKGYHHFKIRPHPEVTMLVEPENDNRYDPFAMKVVMPTLLHIPPVLHQEETRPRSQRHPMWDVGPSPTDKNCPDNFILFLYLFNKGGLLLLQRKLILWGGFGEVLIFIRVGIPKAYYYRTCDFQGVASIPCAQTPSGFALNRDPLRRYISLK